MKPWGAEVSMCCSDRPSTVGLRAAEQGAGERRGRAGRTPQTVGPKVAARRGSRPTPVVPYPRDRGHLAGRCASHADSVRARWRRIRNARLVEPAEHGPIGQLEPGASRRHPCGHDGALVRSTSTPGSPHRVRPRRQPLGGSMSGVELVLAFLAGVLMGGALDRFVLPLLVDAWIDRLRRHGR